MLLRVRLYALTRCDPCMKHVPDVLLRVAWQLAQFESLKTLMNFRGLPSKYRTTRLTSCQPPWCGDDMRREHTLLANAMSGRSIDK